MRLIKRNSPLGDALTLCAAFIVLATATDPVYSRLVLQWNIEEGSGGQLYDSAGNGNYGTFHGGAYVIGVGGGINPPEWTNTVSKWPGAGSDWSLKMVKDGGVTLDKWYPGLSAVNMLTDMTIECWIREDAPQTIGNGVWNIVGIAGPSPNDSGVTAVRVLHGGTVNRFGGIIQGAAAVNGITTYTYGAWHHIAVVMSKTEGTKGYMDGNLEWSDPTPAGPVDIIGPSRPGGWFFIGHPNFPTWVGNDGRDCYIDELRVWDEARTAAQLQPPTASWNTGPPPPPLTEKITISTLTGGGACSAGSGARLCGIIGAYGLPNGYAGRSQSATTWLEVGFFHALVASLPRSNSADPAWLEADWLPGEHKSGAQ